jgi:hypothetical protein
MSQYVHCYAHCLNLVLVQACTSRKENPILFNFFRVVQSIYTFIEGSCSRHAVLEKVAADVGLALKTLKSVSTTRWACTAEAVPTLRNNYSVILLALEVITNTTQHSEVSATGHGPLYQMKTFEFVFSLEMMHPILQLILEVRPFSLLSAMSVVQCTVTRQMTDPIASTHQDEDQPTNPDGPPMWPYPMCGLIYHGGSLVKVKKWISKALMGHTEQKRTWGGGGRAPGAAGSGGQASWGKHAEERPRCFGLRG